MPHERLLKQLVKQEGTEWGCFELPDPTAKRDRTKHVPFAVDYDAPQRACKVKKEQETEPELTLQPVKKRKDAPAGEANAQALPKPAKTREPSVAQLQARAQAVVDADAGESEELARLRARLEAAKAKERETREELAQMQQTLAQSVQAPFSKEQLAAAVRAETQQLEDDRALMAADIEAKNRTITSLQEQVDKAKGDRKILQKEGHRLLAENARLASELNDRIFELKGFEEIKADQTKLNDLLAESEEEVRNLRAQLGRAPSRDNASGRWSKRKRSEVSKAKGKRPMGADADSDSEDDADARPLLAVAGDGADSDSSAEVGNDSSDESEAARAGSGEDSDSDDSDSDSEQAVRKKTKRAFVAFNKKMKGARAKAAATERRRHAGARGSGDKTRGAGKLSADDKIQYERPTGLLDRREIDFSQVQYFVDKQWENKAAMLAWARDVFKQRGQKVSGGPFKVQAALDLFALPTPGTNHFANKDFEAFIAYWANWQNTDPDPLGLQGKRHYLASLLYPETFGPTQEKWLFKKVDEVSDEAKAKARRIDALKGKTNKYLQMIWWWNKHLDLGNIRVKNAL